MLTLLGSIARSAIALIRSPENQAIVELALRHRARKIQAELLEIHLGLTTITRCLPKVDAGWNPHQRWMTFLRNHRDVIAGMDFFVVPTVCFHLLYVWFVLDHGRRRVLHYNVTRHPSARWVIQQLRATFPDQPTHRYLVLDNDAIFSADVVRTVARFGIHPQRTALQSPWQNGTAERFVGTVRPELLDHVVVLSEDHLRRLLREYVAYYNTERVHTSIGDSPDGRAIQERPPGEVKVIGLPRTGGLHLRYAWAEAV
jgi:transposase InsO family protein